jgi:O-antigen/teichoic acid export membrane protein
MCTDSVKDSTGAKIGKGSKDQNSNGAAVSSRSRDLLKQGWPLFAGLVLASLAAYGFHFFASRRLGVDVYGALASLLATVTLISTASQIGATIVARFAAEFSVLGDRGRLRRLFEVACATSVGLLLACLVTALVLNHALAAFFRIESAEAIVLAAAIAGLVVTGNVLRGLMQGAEEFMAFSISFIIENVGRALVASVVVALGAGMIGAFWAQVAACVCAVAYTYVQIASHLKVSAVKLRLDVRRLLLTSGGIAAALASMAVLSYFDVVLAKHYLTPHEAGLYSFATLPGRALSAIVEFVPTVLLPKATAAAAARTNSARMLVSGLAIAAGISAVMLAAIYVFRIAIPLTAGGSQFAGAAQLIFPYAGAAALFGLSRIAVSYNIGAHHYKFVPPLIAVVVCEIAGIALFHQSASQVVWVVVLANAAGLAACVFPFRRSAAA